MSETKLYRRSNYNESGEAIVKLDNKFQTENDLISHIETLEYCLNDSIKNPIQGLGLSHWGDRLAVYCRALDLVREYHNRRYG